ncbi:MAG: DoxX family membrane protein [Candidatus Omnitrophota bacterium]|nr:DoxX family membrane protein [Candidatus Omnitrophota bacterium]MDZ4243391.1 DoxX family membrane protein [Candidatus Omnitrophota bacterium]
MTRYVFVLRIVLGFFFAVIAGDKLLYPYQNFLYIVQQYQLFPAWAETFIAIAVPWGELFLGLFCVLGLWTTWSLRGLRLLVIAFLLIVGQAMIRGLPVEECGCFGGLFSSSLPVTFGFDLMLFAAFSWMIKNPDPVTRLSVDRFLDGRAQM